MTIATADALDYRPRFPSSYKPGIGLIGCGDIAKTWHLPAYGQYGVNVVGAYDPLPEATRDVRERFPFVSRVYASLEALLGDPAVEIVDIATRPDVRPQVIRQAVAAGKHVLAQKPLALDARTAREVIEEAERCGVLVAVNQNGRWAPPWRIATLLVEEGAVGDVFAVTHLYDRHLPPLVGTTSTSSNISSSTTSRSTGSTSLDAGWRARRWTGSVRSITGRRTSRWKRRALGERGWRSGMPTGRAR